MHHHSLVFSDLYIYAFMKWDYILRFSTQALTIFNQKLKFFAENVDFKYYLHNFICCKKPRIKLFKCQITEKQTIN